MTRKIQRYGIQAKEEILLPLGAEVLHVEDRSDWHVISCLIDPEQQEKEQRTFEIVRDDQVIDWTRNIAWIGSTNYTTVFEILKPLEPKPTHK